MVSTGLSHLGPMLVLSLTSSELDKFPICTMEVIAVFESQDAKEHEMGIIHVQHPSRARTH